MKEVKCTSDQEVLRNVYEKWCKEAIPVNSENQQNIFTPYDLCEDIIGKLQDYTGLKDKIFLVGNFEFAIVLMENGVSAKQIEFWTDCKEKMLYAEDEGVKVIMDPKFKSLSPMLKTKEEKMAIRKFDVVIMNPPYQTKSNNSFKKTQPIWDKFVVKAIECLNEDGFLCAIHPSGWRNVSGIFSHVKDLINSKCLKFLSINDVEEGMRVFGCGTRFDWYILQNNRNDNENTDIQFQDKTCASIFAEDIPFIPNFRIDEVISLMAKDNETKCKVVYSRTAHGSDKPWMSDKQTNEFQYPCIQHVSVTGKPSCVWYSSIKPDNTPKIIFSSAQVGGVIIDEKGEYGVCQACSAIIAPEEDLPFIKKAMDSKQFIELMKACDIGGNRDRYPYKIISLFRKDFWKEFLYEENEEETSNECDYQTC